MVHGVWFIIGLFVCMFIKRTKKKEDYVQSCITRKEPQIILMSGLWGLLSTAACDKDAAESFESLWHCGAKGHRPDAAETGTA